METGTLYGQYQDIKRLIAVDCAIFGYENEELKLLLFKRVIEPASGQWSLIGGWIKANESAEDAAQRVLRDLTGLKDIYLEQVKVFSNPDRDPGGSVLSVAFYALIEIEKYSNALIKEFGASWFPIRSIPRLIFDHEQMVEAAYEKLKLNATYRLIGRQLLPERFTLSELRTLYSEIFQKDYDPGNFRKKVLSLKQLERLDEKDMSASKKGAYYYRFKAEEDSSHVEPIFKSAIRF
jgi:8-oxo-dGTP diphosphatase